MITPSFAISATERVLPRMALDFTTASLDSRVTFTRTGNTAAVTNSSGYVVPINADLPRFDFDPIALTCKGLLIEESRTNLSQASEQFDSGFWVAINITVGADAVNAPSNTLTADKLKETSATGEHMARQSPVYVTSTSYTASVFAKAAERGFLRINCFIGGQGSATAYYNLSTGVVSSSTSNVWALIGATITPYANGFYRCTLSFTVNTSGGAGYSDFAIAPSSGTASYAGTTDSGIYVWGSQLEVGTFATSYIPTTVSQVTRTSDVALMTSTNFSSWYNASQGSLSIETAASANANTVYACISDGNQTVNSFYFDNDSGSIRNITFSGSAAVSVLNLSSIGTVGATVKLVGAYNLNSYAASKNAGTPVTGSSGAVPVAPTELRIGSSPFNTSATYVSGCIKKVSFFPQRLINAEVQAFSK